MKFHTNFFLLDPLMHFTITYDDYKGHRKI